MGQVQSHTSHLICHKKEKRDNILNYNNEQAWSRQDGIEYRAQRVYVTLEKQQVSVIW